MTSFAGQSVMVTGAASGIGLSAAAKFAALGATVFGVDLDPTGAETDGVQVLAADVSRAEDVERVIEHVVTETGRLDVLCNNAGRGSVADPLNCTVSEWEAVFAVNARGVFLGTKYALAHMLTAGSGVIVNTASAAGLIGLPDRAAYCASKGAVIAFTRQVAVQYARQGIRCNCVCPGTVDSPWVGRLLSAADDPDAARAQLVARQPLGRLAGPEEIADAIVYLAGPSASFMTGTALVIDGGITAA